ncbi:MAG: hypothetical protein NTW21_04765 [Verrucomicrobia bacterium]|nr:hypothetical protein [Verrucomicrobiota bacterium]
MELTLPDGSKTTRTLIVDGNMELVVNLAYQNYAQWQGRYFTTPELANAAISGAAADPDGDGDPNLLEHLFGHDPRSPARDGSGVWAFREGGQNWLGYRQAAGVSDVSILLQTSPSLQGGTWTDVAVVPVRSGEAAPGIDAMKVAVPASASPKLFWRLKVTKP